MLHYPLNVQIIERGKKYNTTISMHVHHFYATTHQNRTAIEFDMWKYKDYFLIIWSET